MDLSVSKGGVCWAEFTLGRNPKGLEVFIRTVPEIEAFISGLSDNKTDSVESWGREWYPISSDELRIYTMDKHKLEGDSWTLEKIGEPLIHVPNPRAEAVSLRSTPVDSNAKKTNLGFLRVAGISSPDGLKFGVYGPFSKDFIDNFGREIVRETRNFVQQYILPVRINLRIVTEKL